MVIARQALTTTICDKQLNANATRWEEAQAVVVSLRDCPLTWRRNTQIQMYWLWKWLESYNNCTFSTWKDKFLFSLLFWIPNSFCTFHDYARGGTPFLAFPDGPALIFYHSDFWTTFFLWKTELPWNFLLWWNIFYLSGLLSNLWIALKNRVCPEFTVLNIYIYLIIQNFEQLAHALKNRVCPEIFHCIEIFFIFQDFWGTCACPENGVCHESFRCI